MELRQLTYFACLYREGTVTRAAQRLNIVQPALSMQIAKLEHELGQTLFDRTPKGMTPTPAGEEAYRLFAPLLEQLLDARRTLAGRTLAVTGRIRIGLVASATNDALSSTLAHFAEHHPHVQVYATPGFSMELVDKLRAGELDCAVINQSFGQGDLVTREILNEQLVLTVGAQTPLPTPIPVPLYALSALPLVLPSHRHGLRIAIEDVLQAHSIHVNPRFEVDDATVIEGFITRTDWISLLPASLVNRGLRDGSLRACALAPPGISRRMLCVSDPARPVSAATTRFIDVLSEKLTALQQATGAYTDAVTPEEKNHADA